MPYIIRRGIRVRVPAEEFARMRQEAMDGGAALLAQHEDIIRRMERGEIPQPRTAEGVFGRARPAPGQFIPQYNEPIVRAAPEEFPPLTFPLIPETDGDGTKRLYKTRYAELEKKYAALYGRASKIAAATAWHEQVADDNAKRSRELETQLQKLHATAVDSELVVTRMDQVCKELGLTTIMMNQRTTMAEKLNSFFGALMTRIRCEEIQDELAD